MKFSVLMTIYEKENPKYFDRAMKSIWDDQNIKPNEIVLVEDGKLTKDLYDMIAKWKNKLGDIFKVVSLEKNIGQANALNIGIDYCNNELIARMDTDDISTPDRFEKQLKAFKNNNIDVCSAFIGEFENDENKIFQYRKLPERHEEIVKYAKIRSPLNHAAVMYKKTSVKKAGGYEHILWMEDYYLWVKMILNGAKLYNIQDMLLKVRVGNGAFQRRRGWKYIKNKLIFLKKIRDLGFINTREYIKNIVLKVPIRMMPESILKFIYKYVRSKEI